MDNGKISTILITIALPILGFLVANPDMINNILGQYGLIAYTPLVISLIVAIYNYLNPRVIDETA